MRILHTAVPPLANGSSQPSVFNIAHNLRALGYTPMVDLKPLEAVEKHFTAVAKKSGLPIGKPVEYDQSQYLASSPRRHDLQHAPPTQDRRHGAQDGGRARRSRSRSKRFRLSDHGDSAVAVCRDSSCDQRVLGERYKEVPDQVIQYALGFWGKEAVEVMDPDVRDKILSRPRAKEWTHWEQPEPTLNEVRQKLGVHLSDEELILRFFAGDDYVNALPDGGKPREYLNGDLLDKADRTTQPAQGLQPNLHQATRLLSQNGKRSAV